MDPIALRRWLTPAPRSRSFICGSVGSGKSTLGCEILESYHAFHPAHRLYLCDPKRRFFATEPEKDDNRLFPDGATARVWGRSEGVRVHARLMRNALSYRYKSERVYLLQDHVEILKLFLWLFEHHNVREPVLLYNDESFDLMRGARADPGFRRLVQMGRELGIGHLTVNQRPAWIDAVLLSESERLYIGNLHNINDRKRLAETANLPNPKELLVPLPQRDFYLVDQIHPDRSRKFHLAI